MRQPHGGPDCAWKDRAPCPLPLATGPADLGLFRPPGPPVPLQGASASAASTAWAGSSVISPEGHTPPRNQRRTPSCQQDVDVPPPPALPRRGEAPVSVSPSLPGRHGASRVPDCWAPLGRSVNTGQGLNERASVTGPRRPSQRLRSCPVSSLRCPRAPGLPTIQSRAPNPCSALVPCLSSVLSSRWGFF